MKQPNETIVAIWGTAILDEGNLSVPNIILDHQKDLNLTPEELNLLLQVFRHKFNRKLPFPSESTIAERMGMSLRQIQRISSSLRTKNFLVKKMGSKHQVTWNFNGLIHQAVKLYEKENDYDKNDVGGYDKNDVGGTTETTYEENEYKKTKLEAKPSSFKEERINNKREADVVARELALKIVFPRLMPRITNQNKIDKVVSVLSDVLLDNLLTTNPYRVSKALDAWIEDVEDRDIQNMYSYFCAAWTDPHLTQSHPVGRYNNELDRVPDKKANGKPKSPKVPTIEPGDPDYALLGGGA